MKAASMQYNPFGQRSRLPRKGVNIMMTGIGMGLGGIGLLIMILFLGGLIFGGVWLVKTIFSPGQQYQRGPVIPRQISAREILDQRYARGEITREQYETMKKDLQ
jgi:putative membrane protein